MPGMLEWASYIMGQDAGYKKGVKDGEGHIVVDGTNMTFTDDGEGNLTITVTEE